MREYYVQNLTQQKAGRSLTDHVPKYLPGSITKLAHCNAADLLACTVTGDRASLYVYRFRYASGQSGSVGKVQSAWSVWNFQQPGVTAAILGVHFLNQTCYLAIRRTTATVDQVCLEALQVDSSPNDSQVGTGGILANYVTHLDRRLPDDPGAAVTKSYDPASNRTTYSMSSFLVTCPSSMAVVTRYVQGSSVPPGVSLNVVSASGNQVQVQGDQRTANVWIGEKYTMRFRFTPFAIREATQQGSRPALGGRLQLRTLTIRFAKTGSFRVEVTADGRPTATYPYTGIVLGDSQSTAGSPPLVDGKMRVLLGAQADRITVDLVNDSPLPSRFTDCEWEGFYFSRASRM